MSLVQEIFLESDWDEMEQAQIACHERMAQLQAEGHLCTCTVLYRITDSRRVFLLEAQHPDTLEPEHRPARRKPPSQRTAPRN